MNNRHATQSLTEKNMQLANLGSNPMQILQNAIDNDELEVIKTLIDSNRSLLEKKLKIIMAHHCTTQFILNMPKWRLF